MRVATCNTTTLAMEHVTLDPCYTCRTRRIQCDQSGVPCAKCEKAGLECFDKRPFRWVKGVALRGKMQGRSYGASSTSAVKESDISVSANAKLALKKRAAPVRLERPKSQGLPIAVLEPSFQNLDRVSRYYIDYYNERICKLFIVYESDHNPFRRLIALGLKDPILLKALLALAARHHVNTGRAFHQRDVTATLPSLINANSDALYFKHQAMEALSLCLRDTYRHKQDSTVASVFLLIFLDLLESGSDGWNFHLEGAKRLIASTYKESGSQPGINRGPGDSLQEIREFITQQINQIETLGATFLRPQLLSRSSSFDRQQGQVQETIERSFLGCPEYVLRAIQRLSMQRNSISRAEILDPAAINDHFTEITRLLELIEEFDSHAWACKVQQSRRSSSQELVSLSNLSQTYKLGTILYGRRILESLTGKATTQDALLSELFGGIDSLRNDTDIFKCILWPIFIAGLECDQQAQRTFLVECLEQFWAITNCLNAVNAAKVLHGYWCKNDSSGNVRSQWIYNIGLLGRDWLWI